MPTTKRLTEEDVLTIFKMKSATIFATKVAAAYNISEKTVRDIWKGRTWAKETWHLETTRTIEVKKMGRPAGCKDSRPRKTRSAKVCVKLEKNSIDDVLYEWEQNRTTQLDDAIILRKALLDWASQESA